MSNHLLKGKRGIIFGALNNQSIAWKVAQRAHEEGATFVLTNAPIAMRMGEINELAAETGSQVIAADATNIADLENLVTQAQEIQAQARARAWTQEQEDSQALGHDHAQDHAQAEAHPPQASQQEDQEQAQLLQALVIQPTRKVEKPFDVKFANPLEQLYEDNNNYSFMPFRAKNPDEWTQEHMTKACLFQISHYVY